MVLMGPKINWLNEQLQLEIHVVGDSCSVSTEYDRSPLIIRKRDENIVCLHGTHPNVKPADLIQPPNLDAPDPDDASLLERFFVVGPGGETDTVYMGENKIAVLCKATTYEPLGGPHFLPAGRFYSVGGLYPVQRAAKMGGIDGCCVSRMAIEKSQRSKGKLTKSIYKCKKIQYTIYKTVIDERGLSITNKRGRC